MSKLALVLAVSLSGLFVAFSLRDPLAVVSLSSADRAAGYEVIDLPVNGENCRFCRVNVEQTLRGVAGVKAAKADMAHHRARVAYDPAVVQPSALELAIQGASPGAP
jgi:copper chaperone CopZ